MSGSCVSVEPENALVVAAVVTTGVGCVGEPGAAEGTDDEVADGSVCIGLVPGADALQILGEGRIPDVILAVLDGPVPAGVDAQVAGSGQVRGQAGDAVGDLLVRPRAVGGPGVAADAEDLAACGQAMPPAGAARMLRRSRRPCPVFCSAQVVSAKSASGPARARTAVSSSVGWLPLMIIR